MSDYRVIVKHVRYWRGQVHRWSNSFEYTGSLTHAFDSAACDAMRNAVQPFGYQASTGAVQGGIWGVTFYNAGGGVPLASKQYFDPLVPAGWLPYTGTVWGNHTPAIEPVAEVAMTFAYPAGISSTGKPIHFRKYIHAVPDSVVAEPTGEIVAADIASIKSAASSLATVLNPGYGVVMGNSRRFADSTNPSVNPFYVTHQMRRGRRKRPVAAVTAQNALFQSTINALVGSTSSQPGLA